MKFKPIVILFIVTALFLCGCVSINEHVKVSREGEIENDTFILTIDNYESLRELTEYGNTSNHLPPKGELCEDLFKYSEKTRGEKLLEGVKCKEKYPRDKAIVVISPPPPNPKVTRFTRFNVTKQNGYIVFKQTSNPLSSYYKGSIINRTLVDYNIHLEMPREIVDSNADEVEGNKAVWYNPNTKIYAKSKVPLIPGFGVVIGIVSMVLASALLLKKK